MAEALPSDIEQVDLGQVYRTEDGMIHQDLKGATRHAVRLALQKIGLALPASDLLTGSRAEEIVRQLQRLLVLLPAVLLAAGPALAQSQFPTPAASAPVSSTAILVPNGTISGGQPVMAPPSAANPLAAQQIPVSAAGAVTAATIGTASAQVIAATTARKVLAIHNQSATATVSCAFGTTALAGAAGSWDIPPQQTLTWSESFVPPDAVNCLASAAATPVTVEAQ
jgi:hypothetical protein